MHIRWKVRRVDARGNRNCISLTAALLESQRVDGRPRQRYVAGLGTIRVLDELHPDWDTRYWVRVDGGFVHIGRVIQFWHRIDGLELAPEQRQSIESQIASRVPQPTDAQRLAYDEMLEQMGVLTS